MWFSKLTWSHQAVLDECGVHLPELLPRLHGATICTLYFGIKWVTTRIPLGSIVIFPCVAGSGDSIQQYYNKTI